ncbi:small terminase protein [Acinetobacter phage AB-Navy71]|uniref:Terminase small subunit n=1 Tax=Acinetobacter phage AbTZA1 TaxID=2500827 RepID=A0A3T0IGV4_9CAUD|nr:terminase small subunit [Acinetobacter phage AbTZA1]AZU98634.1 terminase small subunit [Acinetobacter phage AbTZA1]UQS94248.1 small terminase protein [Acinetobacter phage AB-Navy71]SSU39167.1 Terminase DNA packaging enzyme [Acinetobacter baumannii]
MQDIMAQIMDCTDLPGMEGEELVVYKPLELEEVISNPTNRTPDLETDYSIVRKNMHFQQQMLMDAAKIFLETAKNADSPRHMEVFATLMGQMTTTNEKILKLHKEMKDITNETTTAGKGEERANVNIENAHVFVGGPTDMMDKFGDGFETRTRNMQVVDEQ